METQQFSIELKQVNNKGNEVFKASAKSITVSGVENLASEISDFAGDTLALYDKLQANGVKGLAKQRLKKSCPMTIKVTAIEDETEVSISVANFCQIVKNGKDQAAEVITLLVNHTSKFAHLWA